jgi:DNA-binding MarR family transcriptional regulator
MKEFGKLDKALAILQTEVHIQLQLHQFRILVMLAMRDPDPVPYADIEKTLNLSNAAVSRNTKVMGTNMQKDSRDGWVDSGLHLIEVKQDVYETRRNVIALTKKGRNLMTTIAKYI